MGLRDKGPGAGRHRPDAPVYAPASVRNPFASTLWRNQAFVRVWSAATISIFGSLVTRIALPLAAILVLGSGAVEVALLRSMELIATLVFGLVAGAWVDRLRRRPVLIWADLGRAALLGSIPVAFAFGVLTFWQLLIVSALAAILTTFFDSADNAYLPIDRRARPAGRRQRRAGGQRLGRRVHRLRDQRLPRPVAHGTDRHRGRRGQLPGVGDPARPRSGARRRRRRRARTASPCCPRSATACGIVRHDPVLRAFVGAQMSLAALWGIFGATWFLFVLEELGLGPAALGVIAGVGGFSSFIGAMVATRATRRFGIGPVAIVAMLLSAVGNAFIPLAPAGLPLVAIGCLVMQQLVADSAATVYDITEVSVRQTLVRDRALGRVSSTFHVAAVLAQLVATIAAGLLAEAIGLRATSWLAPLGGLVGRGDPVVLAGAAPAGAAAPRPRVSRRSMRWRSPSPPRWSSRPGRDPAAVRRRAPRRRRRGRTG